jgi:hypothetical protein
MPTASPPPFRGSSQDPRDRQYRPALDAMWTLLDRRRTLAGSSHEIERLEALSTELLTLARGF